MPRSERAFSGYKVVWLFAMVDLPVDDRAAKRNYVRFRNLLLEDGFSQMQYSVYARCCDSEQTAAAHRDKIVRKLPRDGHVRLLMVTNRQFGKMEVYHGKTRAAPEPQPQQLQLF